MNDNEIIKALECCFSDNFGECEYCPLKNELDEVFTCMRSKQKLAIDLLKRKDAEIERLTTMHSEMCIGIKKLKEFAIKEFAERLNKHSVYVDDYDCFMVSAESIDNLVKEMTEPVKIEHNSLCETETYKGE